MSRLKETSIMIGNIRTLLAALLLTPTLLWAATSGPYTYTVASGQATITLFDTAYTGTLVVTNQLGGYPVTAIGYSAFDGCNGLTSITIPEGITSIGTRAISECLSLTNISLPSTLVALGDDAFYFDTALPCIVIPEGIKTLPYEALFRCAALTNVSLPSTLTSIDVSAFDNCTSLPSIVIPANVTNLSTFAFYGCTRLKNVYFAGPAPSYGSMVFQLADNATVYYGPGTGTWGSTYADRPTRLWNPDFSGIVYTNGIIACTVTGAPPIPVALETTTNLVAGPWTRLVTTNLVTTSMVLADGVSSNVANRFYRVVGP